MAAPLRGQFRCGLRGERATDPPMVAKRIDHVPCATPVRLLDPGYGLRATARAVAQCVGAARIRSGRTVVRPSEAGPGLPSLGDPSANQNTASPITSRATTAPSGAST